MLLPNVMMLTNSFTVLTSQESKNTIATTLLNLA